MHNTTEIGSDVLFTSWHLSLFHVQFCHAQIYYQVHSGQVESSCTVTVGPASVSLAIRWDPYGNMGPACIRYVYACWQEICPVMFILIT